MGASTQERAAAGVIPNDTILRKNEAGEWVEGDTELMTQAQAAGFDVAGMLNLVPDAGGSELEILKTVLAAASMDELDAAWNAAEGLKKFVNKRIRIESAAKQPSQFAGGLGWYLVLHVVDTETGEKHVATNGSAAVMLQVLKAYSLNGIPFEAYVRQSDKATKNGFYPQHLEIVPAGF